MQLELKPYNVTRIKNSTFTFYSQDCLIGMLENISDNTIDIIVTSPPYNIGKQYGKYDDNLTTGDYLTWIEKIIIQVKRVLKHDGSFFLNIGNTNANPWISQDVATVARKQFCLQNKIVWIKNISINKSDVGISNSKVNGDFSAGHFKPVNSPRFVSICSEDIFHFTKHGDVNIDKEATGVPYQDKSNIGRYGSEDIRDRGNVWFIPYDTIQNKSERPHPSAFPTKLPEMCIKLHGRLTSNTIVLDPFAGSGSTAIACLNMGVSFIGFELNIQYIEESIKRLNTCNLKLLDTFH